MTMNSNIGLAEKGSTSYATIRAFGHGGATVELDSGETTWILLPGWTPVLKEGDEVLVRIVDIYPGRRLDRKVACEIVDTRSDSEKKKAVRPRAFTGVKRPEHQVEVSRDRGASTILSMRKFEKNRRFTPPAGARQIDRHKWEIDVRQLGGVKRRGTSR